ncbi:MAG: hypothetical protein Q7S35_05820 [Candidatus Limnocylindrales bacterium]|nr:hypothetical protein [Candidatus Limnocylindrales bacterium]
MSREPSTATVGGRRWIAIGALVAIVALVTACGGGSSGASPSAAGATSVNVTLQEFAIISAIASVPAGTVTFVTKNTGPEDVHELVVVKTDLGAADLPVDKDGKATEGVPGVTLIGEIEDIAVGETKQADLELTQGKYVLICNIVQTEPDGSLEAHYKVGMRTAFEVTAP